MAHSAHPLLADAGDSIAIIDAVTETTLTYDDLHKAVSRWANDLGHLTGRLVLLGASVTIESIVDYLALLAAGATVALVDPQSPADVVEHWTTAYRPDASWGLVHGPVSYGRRGLRSPLPPSSDALLLATSGSTGNPKFVRLGQSQLTTSASQIVEATRMTPSDRALIHLPLFYTYGLSVLNSHLSLGAGVVLTDESAIRRGFWDAIGDHQVTCLPGVPYSYEMYHRMRFNQMTLPTLKAMTESGGKMTPQRILEFHHAMERNGGHLWMMYGQTEATSRVSVCPPEELLAHIGSVGLPVRDVKVSLADVQDGEGELIVEAPTVMLGYATNRDEVDGSDRHRGVLRSGDLARVDSDGYITLTGRLKRLAKVFGMRVNLDDVERQLSDFGTLAAVDSTDGLAVFIEAESVAGDLARRMEHALRLPPRSLRLHAVDRLPTTANGKIDYTELKHACRI
ncbi:MAG: AMP-binding protein [Acidimicrobiia bacterium]